MTETTIRWPDRFRLEASAAHLFDRLARGYRRRYVRLKSLMIGGSRCGVVAVVLAMLSPGAVALAAPLQVVAQGPVIAPGVDRWVLHSARANRDFVVEVTPSKTPSNGAKAPVIYALDAGYGVAGPEGRMLGNVGAMQPAFIVTVGYVQDAAITRVTDLLYEPAQINGKTVGGGGAAFQAFLLKELRPFIQARYPVDPARSFLFGHSLGGLFAANLIARQPQAFDGYLIASPSVWVDPTIIDRLRAVTATGEGKRRVFVGVGGAEGPAMTDGAARMALVLQSSFLVQSRVFAGASHMSSYPLVTATAFPWLLPPVKGAP